MNIKPKTSDILKTFGEYDNPLFIMGCPRSGTSLLSRALACSDSACILEETNFMRFYFSSIPVWRGLLTGFSCSNPNRKEILKTIIKAKARDLIGNGRRFDWFIGYMLLLSQVDGPKSLKPSGRLVTIDYRLSAEERALVQVLLDKYRQIENKNSRFRIIFQDFALLAEKEKVIEKTPVNIYYARQFTEIFPNASFIFIWRNPIQVIPSYIDLKKKNGASELALVKNVIKHWYDSIYISKQLMNHNDNAIKIKTVCYDTFCQSPKDELMQLFEWAQLRPMSAKDLRWKHIGSTDPWKKYRTLSQNDKNHILFLLHKYRRYSINYREYAVQNVHPTK